MFDSTVLLWWKWEITGLYIQHVWWLRPTKTFRKMHIVVPPRKKCLRWQRLWSYVSDCEWWFLLTIGTTLWLLVLIQTIEGGPACCLNHRCCVEITVKNNSINNNVLIEHVMICSMGIGVVCHATQHPCLTVERKYVFIMNSFF